MPQAPPGGSEFVFDWIITWEVLPVECYCCHSSHNHLTTQAPLLHHSKGTFKNDTLIMYAKNVCLCDSSRELCRCYDIL